MSCICYCRMGCCGETGCWHKVHSDTIETNDLGQAKSFRLFSLKRPFMRAFHTSWFCFFCAFLSWFAIQPLLPTIGRELHLSKKDIADTGIASVSADIIVRIVIGPVCDHVGPRRVMSALLIAGSIPLAFSGLVKDVTGLIILRVFISVLGGTFIPCQMWTTSMFSSKVYIYIFKCIKCINGNVHLT